MDSASDEVAEDWRRVANGLRLILIFFIFRYKMKIENELLLSKSYIHLFAISKWQIKELLELRIALTQPFYLITGNI